MSKHTDAEKRWPTLSAESKKHDEENTLRCVASDIIIKLYEAKNTVQLELLQMHVDAALKELRGEQ